MSTSRTSHYRLVVTGRLPDAVPALVADRFGPAAVIVADAGGTVVDAEVDQAGLRALLTLLWDVGQDVQSVCRCTSCPAGGACCQERAPRTAVPPIALEPT